jgi:hypothetical protein
MFSTDFEWEVVYIWQTETIGSNWLEKKTIAIKEVSWSQYPNTIQFDLFKEKIEMANGLCLWDMVSAHLNFKSNFSSKTWKHYQSINCRKLDKTSWWNKDENKIFIEDEIF